MNTKQVNEANREAVSDSTWDQGTYLAETSDLEPFQLSALSPEPTPGMFEPRTTDEIDYEQFGDTFCTKVHAHLNRGELLRFQLNTA